MLAGTLACNVFVRVSSMSVRTEISTIRIVAVRGQRHVGFIALGLVVLSIQHENSRRVTQLCITVNGKRFV